jgi:hypothetical protein
MREAPILGMCGNPTVIRVTRALSRFHNKLHSHHKTSSVGGFLARLMDLVWNVMFADETS